MANNEKPEGFLETTATQTTDVGTYAITKGSLSVSSNYNIVDFKPGTLTIAQRVISVTADPVTRTYGEANPTLTYTIRKGSLVNGDLPKGSLETTATQTTDVGTYAITRGSLSVSSNYLIENFTAGTLEIKQKDFRSQQTSSPANTATPIRRSPILIAVSSIMMCSRKLEDDGYGKFKVGVYAITLGSLSGGNNYKIRYSPTT